MVTEPQSSLASFVDRHTMVYDRWYPHDIALVFEAVSTGEHLDVWMSHDTHDLAHAPTRAERR